MLSAEQGNERRIRKGVRTMMERSTPLDPNAHGLAYGVVYAVFLVQNQATSFGRARCGS
jgi:hypothetical protein